METLTYAPLLAIPIVIGGISHIVYSFLIKKRINTSINDVQEVVSTIKQQTSNVVDTNNTYLDMIKVSLNNPESRAGMDTEIKKGIDLLITANENLKVNMDTTMNLVNQTLTSTSYLYTGLTWLVVGVGTFLILNALNDVWFS